MKIIEIKILVTEADGVTRAEIVTLAVLKEMLDALSYQPRESEIKDSGIWACRGCGESNRECESVCQNCGVNQ